MYARRVTIADGAPDLAVAQAARAQLVQVDAAALRLGDAGSAGPRGLLTSMAVEVESVRHPWSVTGVG